MGWLKVKKRFVGSSGAQKRSAQAPRIKARGEAPRLPNRFPRLGAARCPAIAGLGSQAGTHRYGRSDELQDQAHRPGDLQHCALGSVQPIKAKPKVYPEACLDHWRAIPSGSRRGIASSKQGHVATRATRSHVPDTLRTHGKTDVTDTRWHLQSGPAIIPAPSLAQPNCSCKRNRNIWWLFRRLNIFPTRIDDLALYDSYYYYYY